MEMTIENYDLLRITEEFLNKQNTGLGDGKFRYILYGKTITPKKINTIRKKYAAFEDLTELPILIIDDTVFRSASRSILLTNIAVYYRLYPITNELPIKGSIRLSEITAIEIECLKKTANLMVNLTRVAHLSVFSRKWPGILEANVLNELFKLYMEYLHPHGT